MVEGFQSLLQVKTENKPNTQEEKVIIEKKVILEDFKRRPSITAYNNDNIDSKLKNIKFEPRPSATAYNNDNIDFKLKNSEFEPNPNAIAFNKEFEPIPSLTKYND
ncbi:hypothetical protein AHAS_Ahas13G0068600 [Arachis hypogaea]